MEKVSILTLAALIPFLLYAQSNDGDFSSFKYCDKGISPTTYQSLGGNYYVKSPSLNLCTNQKLTPTDDTVSYGITVQLTVFLEGPFSGNEMETDLNENGQIPLAQPFTTLPWNWPGLESVDSIPNDDIVDWVLVDLRDATDPSLATYSSTCGRKAAFLLKDGRIVDLDGQSALFVPGSFL